MAAELVDWLARSALAIALALAVLLPLRPLWRRGLGAGSVLWLWLLVPAVLVATSVPRPAEAPAAQPAPPVAVAIAVVVADEDVAPAAAADRDPPLHALFAAAGTTPARWLLPLWLVGACALAARLAWRQRAFLRALGPLRARADGSFLATSAGIHPAVVGALRPRIVLPADFATRFDPRQQQLVLAHERVHLRRGDLQANLAMCVLRCVFWFNPLVHLAASRLRLDQELACDARVLRENPGGGRAYASALLNTQLAVPGLPVGCAWQSSHPLKWRIAMLKRPTPGLARLSLGVALALVASSAAAVTLWQAQPTDPAALPDPSPAIAPVAAPSPRPVTTPAPVALPAPTPVAAVAPRAPRSTTPTADLPAPVAPAGRTPSPSAVAPVPPVPAVPATPAPSPRAPQPATPAHGATPEADVVDARGALSYTPAARKPLAWAPWISGAPRPADGC